MKSFNLLYTEGVIAMAKLIAEKSPVVVWGLKKVLNKNRKSNVKVIRIYYIAFSPFFLR